MNRSTLVLRRLLRQPLTFGHAAVLLLVAAVVGGGAFAVAAIPGPDGQIKGCVKKTAPRKGAVRVIDHNRSCARSERTVSWSQEGPPGATGLAGQPGPQGAAGQPGAQGDQGPAGSPDTPAQVLAKLTQVDGTSSGLDADEVDGLSADFFLPADRVRFGSPVTHNDATQDTILSVGSLRFLDDGQVDADHTVLVDKFTTFGGDITVVQPTGAQQVGGVSVLPVTTTDNILDIYVLDQFGEDHYVRCAFFQVAAAERVTCFDANSPNF
jgi:hypothetical protein